MIADNVRKVRDKIEQAAERSGRRPEDVALVCVTKGKAIEEIKEALTCGITDIGENRIQEAKEKYNRLAGEPVNGLTGKLVNSLTRKPIRWHLIGHLQTNKAKDAVAIFDLIHSVDSLKLAGEINKQAARINKTQDMLVEVNTSGEASKYGVKPDELINLVKEIISLENIRLLGLMTIAPIVRDKEEARLYFRKLRELKDEVNETISLDRRDILVPSDGGVRKPRLSKFYGALSTLSMGMSQDYEVAVEEGATIVRVGSTIFEG